MNIKIIFMGSPDFAVPILQKLATNYDVVGVVTQPDQQSGRGLSYKSPAVKEEAQKLGLPVIQPASLKSPETISELQTWNADVFVVAAYGKILRAHLLEMPRLGCINVHASLLPRWRGATPIQSAILHGDLTTGVTIMKMNAGIDTGPILSQKHISMDDEDTSTTLSQKLAELGAALLLDTLPEYLNGLLTPLHQNDALATYAPVLKKEDGCLDFNKPAALLARQVRSYFPWPGTYTTWEGNVLKILRAHAVEQNSPGVNVHTILGHFPAIGTGQGLLVLDQVQLAGKKPMGGGYFFERCQTLGILIQRYGRMFHEEIYCGH